MIMTIPEVLDRAADLIEERGLARYEYQADDGALCMLGALRLVIFDRVILGRPYGAIVDDGIALDRWHLYHHASALLADAIGPIGAIPQWSDTHTKDEAVAALRAEANRVRQAVAA